MKNYSFIAVLILIIPKLLNAQPQLSYFPPTGRLGDQIITYARAYWMAKKWDVDFIAHDKNPFFNYFNMPFQALPKKKYKKIDHEKEIQDLKNHDILIFTDLYTQTDNLIEIALHDPLFKRAMQSTFLIGNPSIDIPKDCISIAIHIRKGGGVDIPLKTELLEQGIKEIPEGTADVYWPLKFPPNEYYLKQFEYLYNLFKGQKLFVFIFTDNQDTDILCRLFQRHFPDENIIFTSRKKGNAWNKNVITDLINMAYFDCLIRSESSYSRAAHLIGKNSIVIYPQSAYWQNDKLIVDKVRILFYLKHTCIGLDLKC